MAPHGAASPPDDVTAEPTGAWGRAVARLRRYLGRAGRLEALASLQVRREAAEGSALPVSVVDARGVAIWTNSAFARLCGRERRDCTGQPVERLLRLTDADPAAAAALAEAVRSGQRASLPVVGLAPQDGPLHLRVDMRPVQQRVHADGEMVLQWLDQTEHVLTSRRLHEALAELTFERERLGHILAGTQVGAWEVNLITGEARMDEPWAALFGYRRAELEPWSREKARAMLHPDDREATNQQVLRHVAGELPSVDIEQRVRHRNGEWIWVHSRGKLSTRTPDGRPEWLAGSHMDIRERKRQEQALEEQRAYMRTLLASLPGVVFEFELDEAGQIRSNFVSDALMTIFGIAPARALAQASIMFSTVPPEDMASLYEAIGESARTLHVLEHEYRVTVDGRTRWLGVHARPRRRDDGSVHWHGMLVDVTRRHELDEQLALARAAAEEANRAKSAFLATMSHEIRSPMNGVLGMTDVLTSAASPEDQADAVQTIRDSARSLLTLIDDILDFSKIEAGRLELESLQLNPVQLAETVAESLASSSAAEDVAIALSIAPGLPHLVWGDPTRLRQILFNLFSNAIKFSRRGPGEVGHVRLALMRAEPPQTGLLLRIEDDGIGMDEATLARLFQTFSQADASTTRRYGGTGLGLAIVRRLVDTMGGTVRVDSRPGHGTRFDVCLPLEVADAQPEPPSHDLAGLLCLLHGDDDARLGTLQQLLCHAGAQTRRILSTDELAQEPDHGGRPVVVVMLHAGPAPEVSDLRRLREHSAADLRFLCLAAVGRPQPFLLVAPEVGVARLLRRPALWRAVAALGGLVSPDVPDAQQRAAGHAPSQRPPLDRASAQASGRLVLVAEDDLVNQKVAVHQLRLLGVFADIAADGQEALALWRRGGYALVFSDLHMPVMDGYTLVSDLRREEAARGLPRTPVLALTANALLGEERRAREAGMDDYLTKPIPLESLQAALRRWITVPEPAARGGGRTEPVVAPPACAEPMLDLAVLRRLVGDDPAVVAEFIADYRGALASHAAEMREAFRRVDPAHAAGVAHRLKSSSLAVGAAPLARLCERLEQWRNGNAAVPDPVQLQRDRLDFERLVDALTQALDAAQQELPA